MNFEKKKKVKTFKIHAPTLYHRGQRNFEGQFYLAHFSGDGPLDMFYKFDMRTHKPKADFDHSKILVQCKILVQYKMPVQYISYSSILTAVSRSTATA